MQSLLILITNFMLVMHLQQALSHYDETSQDLYELKDYVDYDDHVDSTPHYNNRIVFTKNMVSIRTRQPEKYYGDNHFCAGTIIAMQLVLTAGNCVMDYNRVIIRPSRLLVIAGEQNRLLRSPTAVELEVEAIMVYYMYRRHGPDDIAILRLKAPIPDNNDNIKILPMVHNKLQPDTRCVYAGWGHLHKLGPLAAAAVYINLKISARPCPWGEEGYICAAIVGANADTPCIGDFGAPLICNRRLAGVVARSRCENPKSLICFVDVLRHREWIESVNVAATIKTWQAILLLLLSINLFS